MKLQKEEDSSASEESEECRY